MNRGEMINKKCEHKRTYVAVRHESGIKLIKCKDCSCYIEDDR